MNDLEAEASSARPRGLAHTVDRLERFYLQALRFLLLLLASALIFAAVGYALVGLYNVTRDASAVREAKAEVQATDVVTLPKQDSVDGSKQTIAKDPSVDIDAVYRSLLDKYYALYSQRYARFTKAGDARFTREQFDDRFVRTRERTAEVKDDPRIILQDRARIERLIAVMTEVAAAPETRERLAAYQQANKQTFTRTIRGTRPERYCSYFGTYIDECIVYDTREVPFERKVTESRLPAGVYDPAALFAAYHDRFLELHETREKDEAAKAETARVAILEGNARGSAQLVLGVQLLGGFFAIMFLFLLIAIERHQRKLSSSRSD